MADGKWCQSLDHIFYTAAVWKNDLNFETLPISIYVAYEARFILRCLIIINVWERIGIKMQIVLLHNSWQKGCVKLIFFLHTTGKLV